MRELMRIPVLLGVCTCLSACVVDGDEARLNASEQALANADAYFIVFDHDGNPPTNAFARLEMAVNEQTDIHIQRLAPYPQTVETIRTSWTRYATSTNLLDALGTQGPALFRYFTNHPTAGTAVLRTESQFMSIPSVQTGADKYFMVPVDKLHNRTYLLVGNPTGSNESINWVCGFGTVENVIIPAYHVATLRVTVPQSICQVASPSGAPLVVTLAQLVGNEKTMSWQLAPMIAR